MNRSLEICCKRMPTGDIAAFTMYEVGSFSDSDVINVVITCSYAWRNYMSSRIKFSH